MEHNAGINVSSQFLEKCGIAASTEPSSSVWNTDQASVDAQERFASVDSLLQNYIAGFSATGDILGLHPRARIDAILVMSLGIAKQKLLKTCDAQAESDARRQLATLFWAENQFISVPVAFSNPCSIGTSALDYVLWYGDTAGLQTNFVVLRVDEAMDDAVEERYFLAALAAISMIHHHRINRPIVHDTYGLVTDGLKWTFIHVDKEHEYSSLTMNWLEGEYQSIVHLIGKIMDHSVTMKMNSEETYLDWLEWAKMATMWDPPQHKNLETDSEEDIFPPYAQGHPIPFPHFYSAENMSWIGELRDGIKDIVNRTRRGEPVDERVEVLVKTTSEMRDNETSSRNRKRIESVAVTDIKPNNLMKMFNLRQEPKPTNHWRLNPWEAHQMSGHLATTLEQIGLVFGCADENKAVVRLTVDAILLDVLSSIKMQFRQHEGGTAMDMGPWTENQLGRKNLHMALETNISYIFPTQGEKGVVEKLIAGRMDYTLWYGNPKEAETNLLVVETKSRTAFGAGRYQAISYLALIQHARNKAGRAKTPIYGVATDSNNWDFIRMDASGNIDVKQLMWEAHQGAQIISLLRKIMTEASVLSPVPSRELSRQETVEEVTGLCLTKSDGTPV